MSRCTACIAGRLPMSTRRPLGRLHPRFQGQRLVLEFALLGDLGRIASISASLHGLVM